MPIYHIKNVAETIKIGVWKITETQEELLSMLINEGFDETEIYQTKNKQRLKQWLATRILLTAFFKGASIAYDIYGKPQLSNGWHISISHSDCFVAISLNKKNHCGIDIEKISDKVARIKHKFLNEEDLKKIISLKELTIYWSAKEALYKCYGKKEVLFIENLCIENFNPHQQNFKGIIDIPSQELSEFKMVWEEIEGFVLVYTL